MGQWEYKDEGDRFGETIQKFQVWISGFKFDAPMDKEHVSQLNEDRDDLATMTWICRINAS